MKIIQIVRLLIFQPIVLGRALGQVFARGAIHDIQPVPARAVNQHITALVLSKGDGKRHSLRVVVTAVQRLQWLTCTQIDQQAEGAPIIDHHGIVTAQGAMHFEAMRPVRRRRRRFGQIQLRQGLAAATVQIQTVQTTVLGQQQKLPPVRLRAAGVDDGLALPVNAAKTA